MGKQLSEALLFSDSGDLSFIDEHIRRLEISGIAKYWWDSQKSSANAYF